MALVITKLGDDVSTDVIYPGRYMATVLPTETPQFAFADDQALNGKLKAKQVAPGSVIVAGKNFGCGSSREHAPISIKASGASAVIARSFARIFYRNSFNMGLPIFEAPQAVDEIGKGDLLSVDMEKGILRNETRKKEYRIVPVPPFMQELVAAGGLLNYVASRRKGK